MQDPAYTHRLHMAKKGETVLDDPTNLGTYNVIIPEEPYTFGVKHILPRPVPPHIVPPPYVRGEAEEKGNGIIPLGGIEEERVRQAAALARDARIFAGTLVKSGITTEAIDELVHEFIVDHGAYPSPLLYKGFPKAVCTSVNNIIAHGIPDARPLMDGDIVNIDVTVYLNGYHGDTSQTYLVGNVDEAGRLLCEITNAALAVGIKACGPGRHFRDIGNSIHELLKRPYHGQEFSTSPSFTGHGIATAFHTRPWIYHTYNEEPDVMKPGHCFTIEPPIIHGHDTRSWIWPDDWTASTENCARSAQAEHMVLITETGADVLTA
ncbi:methionine aminopeptidase [Cylindrobasidium torrendii FP15055 ss-10]|uniref:Methionine aminopeptidase n=1 Tax=Cylindrobasidium torrendii FP15055 ss-10 TaxID=1314674 RepID=A0A0D7BD25_9AGAR|nr:methionine aminopeptidase [Cylindrobasidium torrendii FP15055 ss-10]